MLHRVWYTILSDDDDVEVVIGQSIVYACHMRLYIDSNQPVRLMSYLTKTSKSMTPSSLKWTPLPHHTNHPMPSILVGLWTLDVCYPIRCADGVVVHRVRRHVDTNDSSSSSCVLLVLDHVLIRIRHHPCGW
jgi:hypothetical protein